MVVQMYLDGAEQAHYNPAGAKQCVIVGDFLLISIGLGASIARTVEHIKTENGGSLYFAHDDEEGTKLSRSNQQVRFL